MDIYTATEQAYKNGYEQGQKDAGKSRTNIVLTEKEYGSLVTRPSLQVAIDVKVVRDETVKNVWQLFLLRYSAWLSEIEAMLLTDKEKKATKGAMHVLACGLQDDIEEKFGVKIDDGE